MSYTVGVDIDPVWNPSGIAAAYREDVTLAEVIDVVYSPTSITIQVESSGALWFVGQVRERVMTVICDRLARTVAVYEITGVRSASRTEARAWRSKQHG